MTDFPFTASALYELPDEFSRLQAEEPVAKITLPTSDRAWLLTRYQDVRTALTDPRFSRAEAARPSAPRSRPLPAEPATILAMDPPEHSRLRRLVSPAFSPRRVKALRPKIEATVESLIDAVLDAGPPADLMAALAFPLPTIVICALLGVPVEDRDRFRAWTDTMLTYTGSTPEQVSTARRAMNEYFGELIEERRKAPQNDLLSVLTGVHDEEEKLSGEELVVFASTLLVAGYHTTSTALSAAVVLLLRDPERYRTLADRPENVPGAVEEILRYACASTSGGHIRVVTEQVTISGVTLQPGEAVVPAIVAANRDPAVFGQPETFDLARADNPHLAFGHGPHFCLGAELARCELIAALSSLVTRLPGLRLAIADSGLEWDGGAGIHRTTTLPVTW